MNKLKKEDNMTSQKNIPNQGFTLFEVIIVVGVMAILGTLTTPALIQFLQKRDQQREETVLLEIEKAMEIYALTHNELPAESDDWAQELASFTNLSISDIATDTWGNPRTYIHYTTTQRFLDADIDITYASLHSRGVNRGAETSAGIPDGATENGVLTFADVSDGGWWQSQTDPVSSFSSLRPEGDDLMIKFTNYKNIIDGYHDTLERLKNISAALESYSQSKYAEAVVANNSLPEASQDAYIHTRIYYPPSDPQSGTDSGLYSSLVTSDMSNFSAGSRIYSSTNDATRRDEMIQLMRILGLPDSNCCNATTRFTSGSDSFEVPFYYFSNPRPRTSSGCGTRPGSTGGNLSARITTTRTSETCG